MTARRRNSLRWNLLCVAIVALAVGCATPDVPRPALSPTVNQPSMAAVEMPESEESSFTDPEQNRKASADIASADTAYEQVILTTKRFQAQRPTDCGSKEMVNAIELLRPVDENAMTYAGMATDDEADLADREAALDVLDTLNSLVLDGLLEVTRAYRLAGCAVQARALALDIKQVYTGDAYKNWATELDREIALLPVERPPTRTTSPAKTVRSPATRSSPTATSTSTSKGAVRPTLAASSPKATAQRAVQQTTAASSPSSR